MQGNPKEIACAWTGWGMGLGESGAERFWLAVRGRGGEETDDDLGFHLEPLFFPDGKTLSEHICLLDFLCFCKYKCVHVCGLLVYMCLYTCQGMYPHLCSYVEGRV